MKQLISALALILLLTSSYEGQSIETKANDDSDTTIAKNLLLSDLKNLETESLKLDKSLARALAKAEIADAAWVLDQTWAKKLLTEAYELTFPDEEKQIKLRNLPVGILPSPPTDSDRAQLAIRNRVLGIAVRDKAFANQLAQLGAKQLGTYEEHLTYASLAARSLEAGDKEAASKYLLQSVEADPTQITAGYVILDLAAQDRAAADRLIIQYIERLRTFPLSSANQSLGRTHITLSRIVFPSPDADRQQRQIPPPGAAVMRAYVSYIIETLSKLEQSEPGILKRARGILLTAWLPLKQHAPELAGPFLELERLSRRPGEDASLPHETIEEVYKERYEKRLKDALDSGQPDEFTIRSAIGRGDFDKARKMLAKLDDGPQKTELTETVNMREAISLAMKDDILGAERLAEKLNRATSILNAYPVIIEKCVAKKDQPCAANLVHQAMKQLKRADTSLAAPPAGLPASVIATGREFDPVLMGLSKLAKSVARINETLALEVMDEMILAANRSNIDTGQGRTGFETDVFRTLIDKDEVRVRQAANNLQDRLRRIVALAAIYQQRAEELSKKAKANP